MQISFRITYRTVWGENIFVEFPNRRQVALFTTDGEHWEGYCETEKLPETYRYIVKIGDEVVRREEGQLPHRVSLPSNAARHLIVQDYWRDRPYAAYLFTSAFSGAAPQVEQGQPGTLILRAICPTLHAKNQILALTGETDALGDWRKPILMTEIAENQWQLALKGYHQLQPAAYKFVAVNARTKQIEEWEGGENRHLYHVEIPENQSLVLPEEELYFPSTDKKIVGTAVPVFSLRSEGSQGVGDFGDLKILLEWAERTGQKAIQILPINDTNKTGADTDSYPYSAISSFALHPMYCDLRQMPDVMTENEKTAFKNLNEKPALEYAKVNKLKQKILKRAFRKYGQEELQSIEVQQFINDNEYWLKPFNDAYYTWLQWHLHRQLKSVCDMARAKGIIIKGDIPIGVDKTSMDVKNHPNLFNLDGSAGAPPDDFAELGQNWGFPTYNWDEMAKDDYAWWRRRLRKMAEYFTAFRIDHILGFFRIWEIPSHCHDALLGQFNPALPLTKEEIHSFGVHFQEDKHAQPYINVWMIDERFGAMAKEAKELYLQPTHDNLYALRPICDTQRKIAALDTSDDMKKALSQLTTEVLFVRDTKGRGWHPRIAAHKTAMYYQLSDGERAGFDRLYEHYFYERHHEFWAQSAMRKLPSLLNATKMLACGEDLGMVPACVPDVMAKLGILSLEIERMPKAYGVEFGDVTENPLLSVCTTGTHDMTTLRGWWMEDREKTVRYNTQVLENEKVAPRIATAEICEQIIRRHVESPSLLCILPLQDWLALDERTRLKTGDDVTTERINVPSNPHHCWTYRMHLTLEKLLRAGNLNSKISQILT